MLSRAFLVGGNTREKQKLGSTIQQCLEMPGTFSSLTFCIYDSINRAVCQAKYANNAITKQEKRRLNRLFVHLDHNAQAKTAGLCSYDFDQVERNAAI